MLSLRLNIIVKKNQQRRDRCGRSEVAQGGEIERTRRVQDPMIRSGSDVIEKRQRRRCLATVIDDDDLR